MTIQARAIEYPGRIRKAGHRLVLALDVARLAKLGSPQAEQIHIVRAMWGMAVHAVFLNRRMLPEEWSAFFRMTVEAGVIDGVGAKHLLSLGTVRVMAVAALHHRAPQLIAEQMRRSLGQGPALVRMTGQAGIVL